MSARRIAGRPGYSSRLTAPKCLPVSRRSCARLFFPAVKCEGVALYWRSLGQGTFRKVAADHRARQAYRVNLPAQTEGAVEYYLEAALEDGRKVLWPATAPEINQTVIAW